MGTFKDWSYCQLPCYSGELAKEVNIVENGQETEKLSLPDIF